MNRNEFLTPNFTLGELIASPTAAVRGINNFPGTQEIAALRLLAENVLQPVRDHFDAPVIVTSGYRSPALNRAIGGSRTSQHVKGEAADFTVRGHSNFAVCRWMERHLNYDQLIYEFGEQGWVHCGYSSRHRNQELSAVKRRRWGRLRTVYLPGLRRA
ncbi:MAG: D-Ala-D-Ala carboxypeptidase family metallohydrolase [Pontixanthobacter sp.]